MHELVEPTYSDRKTEAAFAEYALTNKHQ